MSTRKPLALALAGALIVAAPLLGGCSLIGNFLPGGDNGGIPGGVIPGQKLPDDFPKNDVPLVDGDIVLGLSVPADNGDKAWNVTIKVTGGDPYDGIKDQLTGAGFEYQELGVADTGSSGAFNKDPYTVLLVVAQDGDDWTANYTVTNADTGE